MHIPAIFQLPLAIPFWVVFLIAFVHEAKIVRGAIQDQDTEQDQGTFRALMTGSSITTLAAFILAFLPLFTIPAETVSVWAGMVLIICGAVLRRACFSSLGASFTGVVVVNPGQEVVDRGPYRFVRHPSYTAAFLMYIGLGLAMANWLSLALLFVVHAYLYNRRVVAEEAALLATLGEPYRHYMQRTHRFIPFLI